MNLELNEMRDVTLEEVDKDPHYIRFARDQTEEMCWLAITKDPLTLYYVKNKTRGMC